MYHIRVSEPSGARVGVLDNGNGYRVGRFTWLVDGEAVLVSKDGDPAGVLIETYAMYSYANNEEAWDMAWRMAVRQAKA